MRHRAGILRREREAVDLVFMRNYAGEKGLDLHVLIFLFRS